jgi:hypothetical protein
LFGCGVAFGGEGKRKGTERNLLYKQLLESLDWGEGLTPHPGAGKIT